MFVSSISNSQYKSSFKGIFVFDKKAQQIILNNITNEQLAELKSIIEKQKDNVVNCFIYSSKSGKNLEARIMCAYFINGFKEYYKKFPIFESKLGFIKRLSAQMDKYKEQLNSTAREQNELT